MQNLKDPTNTFTWDKEKEKKKMQRARTELAIWDNKSGNSDPTGNIKKKRPAEIY